MKFELSKPSEGISPLYFCDGDMSTDFEDAIYANLQIYTSRFGLPCPKIYTRNIRRDIIKALNKFPSGTQKIITKKARQESKHSPEVYYIDQISFRQVYAGKTRHGNKIYFCVSCYRNPAGFYLVWKKVITHQGVGARVSLHPRIHARKSKAKAEELAVRLAKQRHQKNKAGKKP